jgi:hypothetical protein
MGLVSMKRTIKNQNKNKRKPTNKQLVLFSINLIILYFLQIIDTGLTIWGVSVYGIEAEGNPLIKYLMVNFGAIKGLLLVKIPALILIHFLLIRADKIYTTNIKNIIISINLLYLIAALMWLSVLIPRVR